MQTGGQAAQTLRQVSSIDRLSQVSFLPAIWGLTFLLFGRISSKTWGLLIIVLLLSFISRPIEPFSANFKSGIGYLKGFNLPTIIQTTPSPEATNITEEEILESEGLVKTAGGLLPFETKIHMFSTSYDKNCLGCNETTATGLRAGYGVVAVDPRVIPLGTKLFIPGYGVAVAGDTGGAIKGNKIDLGFDDVKTGWWSSRFVDVYVLR